MVEACLEGRLPPAGEPKDASAPNDLRTTQNRAPQGGTQCGIPKKGGDPAAPSGTATLLRLHPNYPPFLWRLPPQGLAQRLLEQPTFVV